ncbi:hypothetical protein IE077_003383 [Cardiosporidium cionae]|uniref:Uncharacterized protein n=1 Tax=Cardiosporidium cionae TaxID=476202 RepID=A0ABQ7J3Q2_9APIC|nr:hypothetical protein IE077_003383 [Cardiosporidium cionae]|eukprot:KAF8817732.1 hypothetical protein IE077_003383 [Cardiosporidium cionae]
MGSRLDAEITRQPVILVANKSDLPEKDKQITRTEAEMKAEELGIPFVEVSAKTGEGVNEAFFRLLDMMIENMQLVPNDAVVPKYEVVKPNRCSI